MARKSRPSKTTLTFGLTLEMPMSWNIPKMREVLKESIVSGMEAYGVDMKVEDIKLGLQNKEIKYNA